MGNETRKLKGIYAMLTQGFEQSQMVNGRYSEPPSDLVLFEPDGVLYASQEAPVIVAYWPSEVFPNNLGRARDAIANRKALAELEETTGGRLFGPPIPKTDGTIPHSGYVPLAALFAVKYDGNGSISGHGRVAIGQGTSWQRGESFDVVIVNLPSESYYIVRDDGFTVEATIRYAFNISRLSSTMVDWKSKPKARALFGDGSFLSNPNDPTKLHDETRKTVLISTLTYFFLIADGNRQIPFIVTGSSPRLVVQSGLQWKIRDVNR